MVEVNILSSCNHVNIIRYAGAYHVRKGLETERILIIMEYAETLIQCAKLEKEVKLYLAYVNGMIKDKEAARVRLASAKAEEEEMLEEVEKSIRENLEEEVGEEDLTEEVGMGEQVGGEKNIDV